MFLFAAAQPALPHIHKSSWISLSLQVDIFVCVFYMNGSSSSSWDVRRVIDWPTHSPEQQVDIWALTLAATPDNFLKLSGVQCLSESSLIVTALIARIRSKTNGEVDHLKRLCHYLIFRKSCKILRLLNRICCSSFGSGSRGWWVISTIFSHWKPLDHSGTEPNEWITMFSCRRRWDSVKVT